MSVPCYEGVGSAEHREQLTSEECPRGEVTDQYSGLVSGPHSSASELKQPQPESPHSPNRDPEYGFGRGEVPTEACTAASDDDVVGGKAGVV